MAVDYATLKKGGFMRQKQKNHFSLRLAVVGGNLTSKNLQTIAQVAEKYGDGHVHLTSRQSVEIPFIKLENIDEVKDELAKGDCRPGACGPRVRTVTACQGNQICPSGNIDSYHIAEELDKRYYARELPHKFKVVKVNVNFDDKLAEEYVVAASPTLLFFKEGKEVERIRGLAKRPAIEKVIEKLFQSKENVKMLVTVAGEKKKIEQGTTIAKLIEIKKVENPEYVTVTVNDEFLNRADFETTQVKENDTIEFLYFMGGAF